jgi:adenine deaminase
MTDAVERLRKRARVAQGQAPADIALRGGRVVNVHTREILEANVAIVDGYIAAVGPYDWPARETVELDGRLVMPGFFDSHMHLESTLLTPAELARVIVPHGTTATLSDSHEIGNVLGVPGIEMLLRASEDLPFDLFFAASSCVPAVSWELAGATLGPEEVARLLDHPRVLSLAEVMDVPAVLNGDAGMLAKIAAGLERHRAIDGHAPGMLGRELQAYASTGIRSDHESSTVEEAIAKARAGILVQVREGSSALNLDALLPAIAKGALGDHWCLVTDDIFPNDLLKNGHIDGLLRRCVAGGVAPAEAIRHAGFTPFRHYGLLDRGRIDPGARADIVIVDDLATFRVSRVYKDGRLAAVEGKLVAPLPAATITPANTIRPAAVDESTFRFVRAGSVSDGTTEMAVIGIVPDQIVTRAETRTVAVRDGAWAFDPAHDVALIACVERHRATGKVGLGLVSGFGFREHGAFGSSVGHDSHNLVIAGTNPTDMLACANALKESGGGFVAAAGGGVKALLPLPIGGLLSPGTGKEVAEGLARVNAAARALGCSLAMPFGTLSFLALPVIPDVRITPRGMFDVRAQKFIDG